MTRRGDPWHGRSDGEGADGGMQVITRAAAILGALAEPDGGRSLAQLAAQTGLPKTTVHRICAALEQVGYVHTDATSGRRELGAALLRLAVVGRRDLISLLEPSLERLSMDLNETVDLAVLDGGQVLFVAQHPAPQRALMAIARVGAHFPAYTLASGKALLARLPREEILRRLPRRLEPTLGRAPAHARGAPARARGGPRQRASRTSVRRCATASAPWPWRSPTSTAARPRSRYRCRRRASRRPRSAWRRSSLCCATRPRRD